MDGLTTTQIGQCALLHVLEDLKVEAKVVVTLLQSMEGLTAKEISSETQACNPDPCPGTVNYDTSNCDKSPDHCRVQLFNRFNIASILI